MKHRIFLIVLYCIVRARGCPSCEGDGSTCKLVSGLYTKGKLTPGYNHITTIPVGACSINITLIRPSTNRLAVGVTSEDYFLNAPEGNTTATGLYHAAGTTFYYNRGDYVSREQILGEGPLTKPLNLQLLVSELNRGVEYRYMFPMEQARDLSRDLLNPSSRPPLHPTRHQGKYSWTLKTLTVCSRSCGGGYQTTVAVCIRTNLGKVVPDSRCSDKDKPVAQIVRCNRSPCPASWSPGEWGPCSTTCGEGVQERRILCKQEFSASMKVPVSDKACTDPPNLVTTRKCNQAACVSEPVVEMLATEPESLRNVSRTVGSRSWSQENSRNLVSSTTEWVAQPWGVCSVSCGSGIKERRVHCVDTRGGLVPDSRCENLARPDSEGFCSMGPCINNNWILSDWNSCSAHCGTGERVRRVYCMGECTEADRPKASEECSTGRVCSGEWFTGRWSVCSHSCGEGQQTRDVLCTVKTENNSSDLDHRVVSEELCQHRRKPRHSRKCQIQTCKPSWFSTQWSKCSVECGEGVKTREVVCMEQERLSNLCRENIKPTNSKPCKVECKGVKGEVYENPEDRTTEENDWEEYDEYLEEPEFRDVSPVEDYEEEEKTKVAETTTSPRKEESNILSNDVISSKPVKPLKGAGCTDKFKNCNIVVQSRLCIYSFYQTNCCRSCTLTLP